MEENPLGAEQARYSPGLICESASDEPADEPENQVRYSYGRWSCSCPSFCYFGACRHVDQAILRSYRLGPEQASL